jgi:hypothetical protein
MVRHQHISGHFSICLSDVFLELAEEIFIVSWFDENIVSIMPPVINMVIRAGNKWGFSPRHDHTLIADFRNLQDFGNLVLSDNKAL